MIFKHKWSSLSHYLEAHPRRILQHVDLKKVKHIHLNSEM